MEAGLTTSLAVALPLVEPAGFVVVVVDPWG